MHMSFFFARISVNVRVFFMWVIGQIIDVVQGCSPDAHHVNISGNLASRLSYFFFNLELLTASFLLIDDRIHIARVDQFADELFGLIVRHEQSAADTLKVASELLHGLLHES